MRLPRLLGGLLVFATVAAHAALGPRYGGELHVAGSTEDASLEPRSPPDALGRLLLAMAHETLVRLRPNGTLEPGLALAWTASADSLEWTLTLADGLEFHDGTTITADDAVRSLRRFLRSDSPAAAALADALDGGSRFRARETEDLPGLAAPGPGRLSLRFVRPAAMSDLAPLASPGAAVVSARHERCGPFIPTIVGPEELSFVAFGGHVRGRPYLDRVHVHLVPDPRRETRLGHAHIALCPPGAAVRAQPPGVLLLALDGRRPPLDSLVLRRRIAASIDRAALARFIGNGAEPWGRLLPWDVPAQAEVSPVATVGPTPSATTITLAVDRSLPPLASQRVVAHLAALGISTRVQAADTQSVLSASAQARIVIFEPELPDPALATQELLARAGKIGFRPLGGDASPAQQIIDTALLIPLVRLARTIDVAPGVYGIEATGSAVRIEDVWLMPEPPPRGPSHLR